MISKIVIAVAITMVTTAALSQTNQSSTLEVGGKYGREAAKKKMLQKDGQSIVTCTNVTPSDALRPIGKRDYAQRESVCSLDFRGIEVRSNMIKR